MELAKSSVGIQISPFSLAPETPFKPRKRERRTEGGQLAFGVAAHTSFIPGDGKCDQDSRAIRRNGWESVEAR